MIGRITKKWIGLVAVVMVAQVVFAVPAKKGEIKRATLTNGTQVELMLQGDEYAHWWIDASGKAYLVDEENVATPMSETEMSSLRALRVEKVSERNARRETKLAKLKAKKVQYTGEKRGIVILVNFQDLEMASETAQEDFDRMFNEEGYSEYRHIGSVADYFRDQSYGQLDIEFDVVGPITVSQDYAYYGQNYPSAGDDLHPCEMVIEACRLVDDEVDFSLYDWDGDGEVDQVFIIYAGYGENTSGVDSNAIWPHEWELSSGKTWGDGDGAQTLDGVTVDTYAVSCELAGNTGSTLNGIGTACHEFSHCLGYPDFYDTSYKGGWGMQGWDLLDGGCYNGPTYNGEVPCGYTSYERWEAGWLDPTVLRDSMQVSNMEPLNDTPEAYILYNEGDTDEYYLLENRRADRWFQYVENFSASSGMLIIHVDYDASAWRNNTLNTNADHQRMTIFQANNEKGRFSGGYYYFTQEQYQGHLYPYEENDSLTVNSTPAASLYNENTDGTLYMNLGLWNITREEDGTMSFACYSENPNEDPEENPDPEPDDPDPDPDTGIQGISIGTETVKRIYNLSGQYVGSDLNALDKGIYIVDKQKIVKK